jgi:hypothetical protein
MAKIDELVVEVRGDVADLLNKLDQVSKATTETGNVTTSSFDKMKTGIASVSKGFATFGLAVEGVKTALAPFMGIIDKMNDAKGISLTAERLGISTTKMQEFSFAAKSSGINSETLADAMKDLAVKIKDASIGATSYEEALNIVGLKSKELIDLPVDQQFLAFADAISKADDATKRFALDEINDSMFQLLPLMNKGSEGFKQMADRAHELNAVLDETELEAMNEAASKINEMNIAWESLSAQIAASVAGPLTAFAEGITNLLKDLDKVDTKSRQAFSAYGAMFGNVQGLPGMQNRTEDQAAATQDGVLFGGGVSGGRFRDDVSPIGAGEDVKGMGSILSDAMGNDKDNQLANDVFGQSQESDSMMTGMPFIFTEEGATMLETMRAEEYEAQKAFNESLQALEQANQDYNKKLWESGWKGKSQIMSQTLGQMSTLMNSENRKMFEIGKAAAIAQVAIDTPKAAMSAYSAMAGIPYVGPFLGAAAAAAALATGAMQIQNIKGQSFGGGGGGGGGVVSADSSAGAEGGNQAPVRNVTEATINVTGDGFVSADQVRGLAASLREFQADGGELVIK